MGKTVKVIKQVDRETSSAIQCDYDRLLGDLSTSLGHLGSGVKDIIRELRKLDNRITKLESRKG